MSKPGSADALRDLISWESPAVAGFIAKLDAFGIDLGSTRLSLWTLIVALLVIAALAIAARLGTKLAKLALGRIRGIGPAQKLLAEKLVSIVVWAIAIMVGIDLIGIDLTALTVFSGAFGLAIGFGLQKTFGNLIAGIILLMDRSIKPGDVIAVTDMAGNETFGQIRKIGVRAVSIVTRDEKEYLIPNENLMINQVENWSYSSRRVRIQVPVGVAYTADQELAQRLMLEAARTCRRVLANPAPTVWMKGFGESSVNYTVHCWIEDPEMGVGNVRSDVLNALWVLFRDNGIELPYAQRDINLRETEAFRQLLTALRG